MEPARERTRRTKGNERGRDRKNARQANHPHGLGDGDPSVHRLAALDRALEADAPAVLLTDAHIGNVHALADRCHEAGKAILVRPDLMEGLRADKLGLTILAKDIGVDGIFTGSAATARLAQQAGMSVYWRFFLLDSRALETAVVQAAHSLCDGFELVPGPAALAQGAPLIDEAGDRPVIAGGFVNSREVASSLFAAGFSGVTTSEQSLWPPGPAA